MSRRKRTDGKYARVKQGHRTKRRCVQTCPGSRKVPSAAKPQKTPEAAVPTLSEPVKQGGFTPRRGLVGWLWDRVRGGKR